MDWRSATWARWLGWTVVWGMVVGVSVLAFAALQGTPLASQLVWFFVPSMAAAILIGARFRSWWWAAGPPALLVAAAAILRNPDSEYGIGFVVIPLAMFSGAYAFLALFGVWWGRRRVEDASPFRGGLPGDAPRLTRD